MKNTIIEIADTIGTWIKGDDDIHVFEAHINNDVYSFTINTHENCVLWIGKHDNEDPKDHEKIVTIFSAKKSSAGYVQQDSCNNDIYWIDFGTHTARIEFELEFMQLSVYETDKEYVKPIFSKAFNYEQ